MSEVRAVLFSEVIKMKSLRGLLGFQSIMTLNYVHNKSGRTTRCLMDTVSCTILTRLLLLWCHVEVRINVNGFGTGFLQIVKGESKISVLSHSSFIPQCILLVIHHFTGFRPLNVVC